MAAAITGSINATVTAKRVPDTGFYADKPEEAQAIFNAIFRESGVSADKCDLRYLKRFTFASATAQTIDLTAAVGDDGITNSFVEVVAIAIRNRSTTAAASLTIDNAGATNPFVGFLNSAGTYKVYPSTVDSDGTSIKNSGFHIDSAPNDPAAPVNSSTAKNVRLLPSAHVFDADVVILGRSS
jgi:hypothetical protein